VSAPHRRALKNFDDKQHFRAYLGYLDFFSAEIAARGVSETTEKYIFSPEANGNGALMLSRFVGGA
jgi:hypothetical protein